MTKVKVATLWLDGCSGCHMSLFDLDERLLDLAEQVNFVYTPLVDQKEFPEGVDITLVEGAVSYDEDLEKMQKVRARTRILVSFGDCAVAGNVPTKRNPFDTAEVMEHSFVDLSDVHQQIPSESVPQLLPFVRPLHEHNIRPELAVSCPGMLRLSLVDCPVSRITGSSVSIAGWK